MASQVLIFAETIAAMKRAQKRKSDDISDSDDSLEPITNRGNKFRAGAKHVREGQLASSNGSAAYNKTIVHAGYRRDIISHKPRIFDDDGFEIDSEEDDERAQEAIAAATEFDPYADIRIEQLLAPLTSAADLPSHPSLSRPYVSRKLTELTHEASEIVHKEKATLWRMKRLLTKLSGDHSWAPCGTFEAEHDGSFFDDARSTLIDSTGSPGHRKNDLNIIESTVANSMDDEEMRKKFSNTTNNSMSEITAGDDDVAMVDAATDILSTTKGAQSDENLTTFNVTASDAKTASEKSVSKGDDLAGTAGKADAPIGKTTVVNGVKSGGKALSATGEKTQDNDAQQAQDENSIDMETGGDQDDQPAPRRMRTRAQAQADSDNTNQSNTRSITPDSANESYVHPYFIVPTAANPDRDFSLPQQEAEDLRRLVQLYIQKQEEVCRGSQKLYERLLKADRLRRLVLKWTKAEAHVGEMSDGEDWYDKAEWDLAEDLKKGQDEEEEDAATTAKKTRTRRQ